MTGRTRLRPQPLQLGDRARSKLNRRVGTIDAIDQFDDGRRQYGLHYDEAPQDQFLGMWKRDGAQLPPELLERAR